MIFFWVSFVFTETKARIILIIIYSIGVIGFRICFCLGGKGEK